MLAIRMQRTGRKGHAMFRMVVQDARLTPTSGKVVARLGSYDPHAGLSSIDKEKASFYLKNGAQPSDRVARLLAKEGVELPSWVRPSAKKERKTRNPEKLRKNNPKSLNDEKQATESEQSESPEPATPEMPQENAADEPSGSEAPKQGA